MSRSFAQVDDALSAFLGFETLSIHGLSRVSYLLACSWNGLRDKAMPHNTSSIRCCELADKTETTPSDLSQKHLPLIAYKSN